MYDVSGSAESINVYPERGPGTLFSETAGPGQRDSG